MSDSECLYAPLTSHKTRVERRRTNESTFFFGIREFDSWEVRIGLSLRFYDAERGGREVEVGHEARDEGKSDAVHRSESE